TQGSPKGDALPYRREVDSPMHILPDYTDTSSRISHEDTSMNRLLAAAAVAAVLAPAAWAQPEVPPRTGKSERIELFNGKDIDNWEGHKNRWSVKEGVIVGKNADEVPVSTYLLTKQKYTDFHLV